MHKKSAQSVIATPRMAHSHVREVGPELRRLRELAGFTQDDIAKRLGVQQAAVSKIEQGTELYLSTVERYVEALGAKLRLAAAFSVHDIPSLVLRELLAQNHPSDNQLSLPILERDPPFLPRDVILSIKPTYSEKILSGVKTVELRRRFPCTNPNGALAFIYSTSPVKAIVGTVAIREVLKLPIETLWSEFKSNVSISRPQFDNYFAGRDHGFALVLDDVKSFSRPLPLVELRSKYGFEPPQSFLYAKHELRKALRNEPAVVSN